MSRVSLLPDDVELLPHLVENVGNKKAKSQVHGVNICNHTNRDVSCCHGDGDERYNEKRQQIVVDNTCRCEVLESVVLCEVDLP